VDFRPVWSSSSRHREADRRRHSELPSYVRYLVNSMHLWTKLTL
jgi:hypothetical protein